MRFSLDDTWRDTLNMLRANSTLLLPLAGLFFLLPLLLYGVATPDFAAPRTQDQQVLAQALAQHLADILLPTLLLVALLLLGMAAIYHLLLDPDRPTVGGAIARGVRTWPIILLLAVVLGLIQVLLLLFFSLLARLLGLGPGAASLVGLAVNVAALYVSARTAPAGPSIVAEGRRNPVAFLGRALRLTRRQGWRIALFLLALTFAGGLLILAAQYVLGSVLSLLAGETGVQITTAIVALLGSALLTVLVVAQAAVFRQLVRPEAPATVPPVSSGT